jgi:hypothetical protein
MGQILEVCFIPSISLGSSAAFLGVMAILTTGETEYFMTLMLWDFLDVGDGSGLGEVLVDSDRGLQCYRKGYLHELGLSAHHEDGSLDVAVVDVDLLAWLVVGAEHSDLSWPVMAFPEKTLP